MTRRRDRLPIAPMPRVPLHPWRCECGAVSADWIDECPHCDKPRPTGRQSRPKEAKDGKLP